VNFVIVIIRVIQKVLNCGRSFHFHPYILEQFIIYRHTFRLHFSLQAHALLKEHFNPLNAELNPICHLLVLLGDLTFMGPCIVSIFQYISNKTKRYTAYLYLETSLHVSGGISNHHQECIKLYLQHLVIVTPLLLSTAIVEELEPV
jgi:hypothetical protein